MRILEELKEQIIKQINDIDKSYAINVENALNLQQPTEKRLLSLNLASMQKTVGACLLQVIMRIEDLEKIHKIPTEQGEQKPVPIESIESPGLGRVNSETSDEEGDNNNDED